MKEIPVVNQNKFEKSTATTCMYTHTRKNKNNPEDFLLDIVEWIYTPYHLNGKFILHCLTHPQLPRFPQAEGIEIKYDMDYYEYKSLRRD